MHDVVAVVVDDDDDTVVVDLTSSFRFRLHLNLYCNPEWGISLGTLPSQLIVAVVSSTSKLS